jgi:hypothetical protein
MLTSTMSQAKGQAVNGSTATQAGTGNAPTAATPLHSTEGGGYTLAGDRSGPHRDFAVDSASGPSSPGQLKLDQRHHMMHTPMTHSYDDGSRRVSNGRSIFSSSSSSTGTHCLDRPLAESCSSLLPTIHYCCVTHTRVVLPKTPSHSHPHAL